MTDAVAARARSDEIFTTAVIVSTERYIEQLSEVAAEVLRFPLNALILALIQFDARAEIEVIEKRMCSLILLASHPSLKPRRDVYPWLDYVSLVNVQLSIAHDQLASKHFEDLTNKVFGALESVSTMTQQAGVKALCTLVRVSSTDQLHKLVVRVQAFI